MFYTNNNSVLLKISPSSFNVGQHNPGLPWLQAPRILAWYELLLTVHLIISNILCLLAYSTTSFYEILPCIR